MTIVIFSSLAALADTEYASHHPNSVVIMLSTDKTNYELGAEIYVTIKIKNVSSIPLATYINDNTTDYDLFVKHGSTAMQSSGLRNSPGGKVVSLRGSELGPGSEVVNPGTHGTSSLISDWGLKITEPGTYIITAVSREMRQKSNAVMITVNAAVPTVLPEHADVDFAAQHPNSLAITLSTDKVSYKLGDDILVTISKRNVSPITLQTNVNAATIDYDVFIKHGSVEMQPYPTSRRHSLIVEAPHHSYQLGPGTVVTDPGTHGMSSPISDWGLKIEEPGQYLIFAISHDTKQRSNPVTITVTQ